MLIDTLSPSDEHGWICNTPKGNLTYTPCLWLRHALEAQQQQQLVAERQTHTHINDRIYLTLSVVPCVSHESTLPAVPSVSTESGHGPCKLLAWLLLWLLQDAALALTEERRTRGARNERAVCRLCPCCLSLNPCRQGLDDLLPGPCGLLTLKTAEIKRSGWQAECGVRRERRCHPLGGMGAVRRRRRDK